ncbi:MAG: HNH endonuclease, partial [Candidatus Eisenbacteria bacterium]
LEYDHIIPVARGGQSTIANVRLLCRAHNQYAAERELGTEFMRSQRARAQERRARERAEAAAAMKREQARAAARRAQAVAAQSAADEVTPWLCALGFKRHEAQRAAALAEHLAGASLEDRVRVALRSLAPRHTRTPRPIPCS